MPEIENQIIEKSKRTILENGNTFILFEFRGILQEYGIFTWRVSDCEELVGCKITAPLCSTFKNNVEQPKTC